MHTRVNVAHAPASNFWDLLSISSITPMAPTSAEVRKQNAINNLSTSVPQIFNDAQKPNATQRKHAVALRKIQEQCALNSPARKGHPHDIDPEGEGKFNAEVIRNINKILNVRKREPHADRIVRFIATFMQYTQQLGAFSFPMIHARHETYAIDNI